MDNHLRKQRRERIITKLQEQTQELTAEIEKLQQEIIFNQSIIKELEERSSGSFGSYNDKKSIEIIPRIKEETRVKQVNLKTNYKSKKAERNEF
jgi:hypothetical protein